MPAGKQLRFYILASLIATAALDFGKSQAAAQWGMGFGLFSTVPSPTQFINDHALTRAAAGQKLPSRNVYANNPNSYINRIRDNGFSSHSGIDSRRSPGFEVDRRRARSLSQTSNSTPQPAPVAPVEADPRPVYPDQQLFQRGPAARLAE